MYYGEKVCLRAYREEEMDSKSDEPFNIRKVTEDDAERVLDYINLVSGESDNLTFGINELNCTVNEEKNIIQAINNSKNSVMLIGEINNEIVAMGNIGGLSRSRIKHRGTLAISVLKKYWNLGIGTNMIGELINFAKSHNIEVLDLEVRSDNVYAVRMYKKAGFEIIGVYKKYFKIDKEYYDAYIMTLELK